jgi:hypothetical protein
MLRNGGVARGPVGFALHLGVGACAAYRIIWQFHLGAILYAK